MSVIPGTTKTLPNLVSISSLDDDDLLYVELLGGGSRKIRWADLLLAVGGGESVVNWGEIVSVQTNDGTKIPTAALVYAMNETLEVMAREQQCINGARRKGIQWDLDELMSLVRAGKFDKFAIGDYFVDSSINKEFAIAAKNHYSMWQLNASAKKNHIVCCPFDPLATTYKYNSSTNTNTGGYAASLMPSNMETEYAKLSSKTRGYCIQSRIYENNKGSWAATLRNMRLPTVMEITGDRGCASTEYASNGVCGQLPLFKSVLFRILDSTWYWAADPSSFNTTDFCFISANGLSLSDNATNQGSVRPLIVLA